MIKLPKTTNCILDLSEGWLTIWFNRPEKRNALSLDLINEIILTLESIYDDQSVRGIIFRGKEKFFCSGADLENLNDCRKIVSETDKSFKTVDSFINVAAFTERGTILSTTEENYDKNFNVNVKAPLFMMQEVIKIMIRDKKKGTIAHILSMAAYSGMPFLTAYSSSKAALAVMIKNVANSVSGHQIRVNGVNLGWTDTPAETVIQKKFHNADDDWLKKAEKKVPFKRLNKPIDVAKILAFLCSDESGIMTGSIVDFDQTIAGWHSYSAYETKILDDSILGE